MMANDVLRALAIANGLILAGASAISLMPFTPVPLDVALGFVAASTITVAAWLAAFTARALIQNRKDTTA